MNTEITQLIERYLSGELETTDNLVFEARMQTDPQLKAMVEAQGLVREASKRAAQRELIRKTGKRYHFRKTLTTAAIVVGLAGAAAVATWAVVRQNESENQSEGESATTEQVEALKEGMKELLPIADLAVQYFSISPKDTVVLSENGVLLSLPESAFLLDGKPYTGAKVVQWQEAVDAASIVKSGLSTMSGNRLLETQGMFSLQAFTPEGKELAVNPKVGVYVQVPVDELKSGMQLFEGVPDKNGVIDWQNPTPLEKLPMLTDMKDLNFYPPEYEAKLNELKWKQGKKQRDSLYLSFDEGQIKPLVVTRGAAPTSTSKTEQVSRNIPNRSDERPKSGISAKGTIRPELIANIWRIHDPEYSFRDVAGVSRIYRGYARTSSLGYSIDVVCTMLDESHAKLLIMGNFDGQGKLTPQANGDFLGLAGQHPGLTIRHHKSEQAPEYGIDLVAVYDITITKPGDVETNCRIAWSFGTKFEQTTLHMVFGKDPMASIISMASAAKPADSVQSPATNADESHIPPSKILGFWNPKFNNTILATHDVEKRIRVAHRTCNAKIVEAYTSNLNKKIWEIDQKVAAMGYPEFRAFAEERVGGVELSNPHMNNLRHFYEAGIAQLKEEVKRNKKFANQIEKKWDNTVAESRTREQKRTSNRQTAVVNEETNLNLNNMYRQLGKKTVGFTMGGGSGGSGGRGSSNAFNGKKANHKESTPQPGPLICNIDRFVQNATASRTSGTFTDPQTGKKAETVYNDLKLKVADAKDYDRLMVYLFPHELNSFQRLDPKKDGSFEYALNGGIQYDMAIVGISEKGYFYYEKKACKGSDLGELQLRELTEEAFNAAIERLNDDRSSKHMSVKEELSWVITEQKNYKVQKQRQKMEAFREDIRRVVYPCSGVRAEILFSDGRPVNDTNAVQIGIDF